MWLVRCKLAMWLDGIKDRVDDLAERVAPDSYEGWRKYELWDKK